MVDKEKVSSGMHAWFTVEKGGEYFRVPGILPDPNQLEFGFTDNDVDPEAHARGDAVETLQHFAGNGGKALLDTRGIEVSEAFGNTTGHDLQRAQTHVEAWLTERHSAGAIPTVEIVWPNPQQSAQQYSLPLESPEG